MLALAYEKKGDFVQATVFLRRYMKVASPKQRRQQQRRLRRLQKRVGILEIHTNAKAAIYVDGKRVGQGRAEVVVRPGRHVVRITRRNCPTIRQTLTIAAGSRTSWTKGL